MRPKCCCIGLHRSFDFLRMGYGAALTVVYLAIVVLLWQHRRGFEQRLHYS